MHESTLPDNENSFSLADDDPMPMDNVLGDDEALPQRRRQMAAGERDTYLAELIRLDGRSDSSSNVCGECCAHAQFRCLDCDNLQLYCRGCTVANHSWSPTNRIQVMSLKALSLHIQLGHPVFNGKFVLIDTNGIHEVGLDFCGCETSNSHVRQLLRHGWFPSTSTDPRTAATFQLLCHFQLLSFKSKVSTYEFYHSLVCLTDNMGLTKPKWRHLKILKHFGRGHEEGSVNGTSQGECVIICPACLQPGKNLHKGWALATKANQWLYATFLAIHVNFCLKRHNVSSDEADPSLSTGWSYFVEEADYKSYLGQHLGEKSTCSSHNAVNMANTKPSQGLAATGVGTIDCACHNMKHANGVGDLQKGEKYINMDYLFFSSLHDNSVKMLNVSYNITCQWHKHLWSCMESLPHSHHLDYLSKVIHFFVPKFHLPAHVTKCQTRFLFNFTRFVGHTDGEAPERGWSNINPVAASTKNMGPGCRRDTLDDHFGDWNWKKVVGLGASLLHKMKDARVERAEHQAAFKEFDTVITPKHRATWLNEIEAWEENPNDLTLANPFETKSIAITQAGAWRKLAELEADELQCRVDVSLHPEISPSILIASGLDLEDEQCRLSSLIDSIGPHATDIQQGSLIRKRNSLRHKIETWRGVQVLYMPAVQSLIQRGHEDHKNAEDLTLWLPSRLRNKPCDQHLQNDEWELRYAQAHDALEELCQCLRIHFSLLTFKHEWMHGQGANTRGQNALAHVHARHTMCINRYRSAWTALKSLAMLLKKKDWHGKLQELVDDHIKPLVDPFSVGQGRRQVSWIWMMEGIDCNGNESTDDGVCIEWCKSRARALRWTEEIELLTEEMGRVVRFFNWEVQRWEEWRSHCVGGNSADTEGLQAYAARQADIRWRLANHFGCLWAPYLPQMLDLSLSITSPERELQLPDLTIPNVPLDGY
ncbi:uncharacterized protein EDB91DRAFT_1240417 [Suillus paluster]|uniref:uncharacterized protein n=1 Tax=Suillus paluster TaxID=48578 RepID=UPI001B88341D|nr:uncharacterized protein EDB91DRAFT_1240417 [Suillus paluster]KAG1720353.1 hypothetical protein EDB91DRAFT_1240417 [Suillus paluster]